jgi:hypothetical protein
MTLCDYRGPVVRNDQCQGLAKITLDMSNGRPPKTRYRVTLVFFLCKSFPSQAHGPFLEG